MLSSASCFKKPQLTVMRFQPMVTDFITIFK
uniref:Uncharacterized protein n=1 Tax=Anguilla anguilla TaxID=7936 RepID=A0A0E9V4L4_ANGAN